MVFHVDRLDIGEDQSAALKSKLDLIEQAEKQVCSSDSALCFSSYLSTAQILPLDAH